MTDKKSFLEKIQKTTIVVWTKTHINLVCKKKYIYHDDAPYWADTTLTCSKSTHSGGVKTLCGSTESSGTLFFFLFV